MPAKDSTLRAHLQRKRTTGTKKMPEEETTEMNRVSLSPDIKDVRDILSQRLYKLEDKVDKNNGRLIQGMIAVVVLVIGGLGAIVATLLERT